VADHTAALPDRKQAPVVILLTCGPHLPSIDRDDGTDAADPLPLQRENALEQRHAARKIAALGEPRRERLRRIDGDKGGDSQLALRAHPIEPGRDAPGDVPDEARDRSGTRSHPDRGNGHDHGHEHSGTARHDITRLRRSQAWCRVCV
jgi:hypothetical protein